jgi:hypothetical protein
MLTEMEMTRAKAKSKSFKE